MCFIFFNLFYNVFKQIIRLKFHDNFSLECSMMLREFSQTF